MTEVQRWLAAGGQPETLPDFNELVHTMFDAQIAGEQVRRERACFIRLAPDDPDQPMPAWCQGDEEVWRRHCLFEADLLEDEDSRRDFIDAMLGEVRAEVLEIIEAVYRPVVMQVHRLDDAGSTCDSCGDDMELDTEVLQLTPRDALDPIIGRPIALCIRCVRRAALGADKATPS